MLAALVGVSLGLLGGGGSILAVPILTYVLGMDPREAIAASLFIVGITSAISAISHARAARVRWKTGILFGVAGMVGAFGGGVVGGFIPGVVLMILFAIMMVVTAIAMIRGRKSRAGGGSEGPGDLPTVRILIDGLLIGAATGLVGAGGGFLVVPALNLLGGLPIAIAVGTSLLVIALKSFAGLGGYLLSVRLDWPIVIAFTATAVAGSFVGVTLAGRIPEQALRRGFGIFVLVMGAFVLVQEIPTLLASFTVA
ncbi:sulfite exporter TauE/SafE family protein [Leucobacter denitrificans]